MNADLHDVRRCAMAFTVTSLIACAQVNREYAVEGRRGFQDLLGCYQLVPGPWLNDSVAVEGLWTSNAPRRFELTSEHGPNGHGEFVANTSGANRTEWWHTWSDSVQVGEPILGGLTMTFVIRRDGLDGIVTVFTDVVMAGENSDETRAAHATRVPCRRPPGR